MISSEDIESAVDWLRDSATAGAKARAERIYIESYVKVVLAEQMAERADLPLAAQEREARVSARYKHALMDLRTAVEQDERMRFLRDAASAKIEAWRSQEATRRAEGKAYD